MSTGANRLHATAGWTRRDPKTAPRAAEATARRVHELEAELAELRQALAAAERAAHHNEKLQALGQLISGVAHELANPLTAMIARAALIATAKTLDAARSHAQIIEAQGQRATHIVRNLSAFARRRATPRTPLSLNDVVKAVIDMHGYQLVANQIEVIEDLQSDLGLVEGDPHELEQIVLNLVLNAQFAMVQARGHGQLILRTRSDGAVVQLSVEDDGPGIPLPIVDQIFKPFFSTKGEAGTGLGLAIVRDLVTRHRGTIRCQSTVGVGTVMRIEVPRLAEPADAESATGALPAPPGPRGALLVVDDEPDIGQLIADLLRRRGYDVAYAASAAEALRRARAGRFDGVLTDLRMPGLDGAGLWRALVAERPELASRTIFMTGDHAAPETARIIEATGQPCLPKPFRADELDELLAALRRGAWSA